MTYPAPGGTQQVQEFMSAAQAGLRDKGISCPVVSGGGSPDMWRAHEASVVNEYRVGTYIYNDRSLVERGVCRWADCALTVLSTVLSVPHPGRAVIDAGSKTLTTDLLGLEGHGHVLGWPQLRIRSLSEEHGVLINGEGGAVDLSVGERLQVVPNHCCVVSNMTDSVVLHQAGGFVERVAVAARGSVV